MDLRKLIRGPGRAFRFQVLSGAIGLADAPGGSRLPTGYAYMTVNGQRLTINNLPILLRVIHA